MSLSSTTTTTTTVNADVSYALSSALRKASQTLSVVIDVNLASNDNDDKTVTADATMLSMQLRKIKASALVTSQATVAAALVKEQAEAAGSFPGPCPVLYTGTEDLEAAVAAGVTAVVVDANDDDDATTTTATATTTVVDNVDVIRRVQSVQQVQEAGAQPVLIAATATNDQVEEILNYLSSSDDDDDKAPKPSLVLWAVSSMQADNAEIHHTKQVLGQYSKKGLVVHGIVLQSAVVGDAEDVEYSAFCIDGLTRKKSSTFNLTGLTGSTNGHFGGVASSRAVTWRRRTLQQRQS